MRVDESWWSNASESYNSHQLSSSFDWAFTLDDAIITIQITRHLNIRLSGTRLSVASSFNSLMGSINCIIYGIMLIK